MGASTPADEPPDSGTATRPRQLLGPLAAAIAPIALVTIRALHRGWIPVGDNAYFSIRARDVLTDHNPLLGAWSSGSESIGFDVNSLGPLQLDLLAGPVRLFGSGPGTALAVAAINAAAVASIVVLLARGFGRCGAWLGALLSAATCWTIGSELLYEPRSHHALVLPCLAYLVSSWAVVAGDRWALPIAALTGTLVAQTHLSFVPLVVLFGLVAAGAALVVEWRRPGWRAPLLVTAALLLATWAQPLAEEFGAGRGNLSAVAEAARADEPSYGTGQAVRAVADVLLPPSGWWRSSFREFDPVRHLPSLGAAAAMLGLLVAAHVALGWAARRRGDRAILAWLGLSLGALPASVLAAAASPTTGPFGPVSGNFRYLWPVAVFTTGGLVAALLRAPTHLPRRAAVGSVAALAVVTGVAVLPTSYQSPGPEADAPLIPVARDLVDQVGDADLPEPIVVDRRDLVFGEPFTYPVVDALTADGVEVQFAQPTDLRRFGSDRAPTDAAAGTLLFTWGDAALDDRPGATLVARASALDADERAELDALERAEGRSAGDEARYQELRHAADVGTVAVWLALNSR